MGLPALEFSDCHLDSPQFRERLKSHELELDKTNKFIKELIKDGKALTQALKSLSSAERKFAESLNEFKFQCIGDAETDDEMCIARSLQEFAVVLKNLEDERTRMIENATDVLIAPLERFRKEQIGAAKEARKKYEKETEKYCSVIEKHLNLSSKKKEAQLQELLAFLQGLFTFYHHGYELAKDFSHFKTELTISIQNAASTLSTKTSSLVLPTPAIEWREAARFYPHPDVLQVPPDNLPPALPIVVEVLAMHPEALQVSLVFFLPALPPHQGQGSTGNGAPPGGDYGPL
ncbi:RHG26 protein, partial [Polypterus senegalus]